MEYIIVLLWTLGAIGAAATSPIAWEDGLYGIVDWTDILIILFWPASVILGLLMWTYEFITEGLF